MAGTIGSFFGGLIAALFIVGLIRWAFDKLGVRNLLARATLPPGIFLGFATIAGGYGFAVSEGPVFYRAFVAYLLPAAIAAIVYVLVDRGRRAGSARERE